MLESVIPGFHEVYDRGYQEHRWTFYFTDQDANQALLKTPYAIGVCDLGMIATEHLDINVLSLDGIKPTSVNILTGDYPLSRKLSFIYRKDQRTNQMQTFFDFVFSDDGAKILRQYGYAPISRK